MADIAEKRKRGRPATYSSDAERAKAWRQRQRDLVDAAKSAQPVIVEKPVFVEKIVEIERVVEKRVPTSAKSANKARGVPNASNLFPLLKERFTGYQGEENAKRFRTNAAKAATAAREILSLAQRGGVVPQVEEDFLRQAAQFFEHLNGIFHNAQAGAKRAAVKAEAERKAKHEAKIKELVVLTFGTTPVAADVLAMGQRLLEFDKAAPEWLVQRFKRVGRESWKIPRFCFKPLIYRRESENRPPTPQPSAGNPEHSHQNDLCVPSDMAPTQPVFPD
jgi:hypothetical protein